MTQSFWYSAKDILKNEWKFDFLAENWILTLKKLSL